MPRDKKSLDYMFDAFDSAMENRERKVARFVPDENGGVMNLDEALRAKAKRVRRKKRKKRSAYMRKKKFGTVVRKTAHLDDGRPEGWWHRQKGPRELLEENLALIEAAANRVNDFHGDDARFRFMRPSEEVRRLAEIHRTLISNGLISKTFKGARGRKKILSKTELVTVDMTIGEFQLFARSIEVLGGSRVICTLGERLMSIRKDLHFTVPYVSGVLLRGANISSAMINAIEKGYTTTRIDIFLSLCTAYNVAPSYVLKGVVDRLMVRGGCIVPASAYVVEAYIQAYYMEWESSGD